MSWVRRGTSLLLYDEDGGSWYGVLSNCCSFAAAGNDAKSIGAAPVVLWMYVNILRSSSRAFCCICETIEISFVTQASTEELDSVFNSPKYNFSPAAMLRFSIIFEPMANVRTEWHFSVRREHRLNRAFDVVRVHLCSIELFFLDVLLICHFVNCRQSVGSDSLAICHLKYVRFDLILQ